MITLKKFTDVMGSHNEQDFEQHGANLQASKGHRYQLSSLG
jgi:hypothetical protein